MEKELELLKKEFENDIKNVTGEKELADVYIKYLGRKGKINKLLSDLAKLSPQEKRQLGPRANDFKKYINNSIENTKINLGNKKTEAMDLTLPGGKPPIGHLHPITQTIQEIEGIFSHLGFYRRRYLEVETDFYAFEALNMPKEHPARDEWETFFIDGKNNTVLTPHTSSGQIREMQNNKPPIRMLNIAKCYRRQEDISHTQMFHQFEGLVVDKNISIEHLIGTLDFFFRNFFGKDRKSRLRPYHFQFTEPSFEVDINCSVCLGKGCSVCKEGWLELGGAGMVHPKVLSICGINPSEFNGFAFGWGVERVTMMKYNINDCREMYRNDLRFLKQF